MSRASDRLATGSGVRCAFTERNLILSRALLLPDTTLRATSYRKRPAGSWTGSGPSLARWSKGESTGPAMPPLRLTHPSAVGTNPMYEPPLQVRGPGLRTCL